MTHISVPYAVAFPTTPEREDDSALIIDLLEKRGDAVARQIVLRVGPLSLDLLTRSARRNGRAVDLRPKEFVLLEYMMRRHDQLLTRPMLFRDVWNYKFVPRTNLVDVHMGKLHRKVDAVGEPPMIHSVRGEGFILRTPD